MPRRMYGPSVENLPEMRASVEKPKESVESSSEKEVSKMKSTASAEIPLWKKPVFFLPVCLAVLAGAVLTVYLAAFDAGRGAGSPSDAAVGFLTKSSQQSEQVWKYLPKTVRGMKAGSSSVMSVYNADTHVTLSNLQAVSVSDFADVAALQAGYESLYHKSVSIKDAELVSVTAQAESEKFLSAQAVTYNLICVQVGMRWYVYTGSDVETGEAEDLSAEVETVPETEAETETIVADEEAVLDALKSGQMEIDGVSLTMPVSYEEMSKLFILEDAAIQESDRLLGENEILKFLPVLYQGEPTEHVVMDIANPSDQVVDLSEGVVTTLQVQASDEDMSVILPGGVTFGTTLADAVQAYGILKPYDGADADLNSFDYSPEHIYQVRLTAGCDYNWLYLIFDEKDVLSAVEWRYYDLSVLNRG